MSAPYYLADDYRSALQALLPRGRVWPRSLDATQSKAIAGLAPTCERLNSRANYLIVDAFPGTTLELLPDWESSVGLPDTCASTAATVDDRHSAVVSRISASGGQSVPYFIGIAKALGYTITITQFVPFRFGQRFGMPLCGNDWAFAWQVNAPQFTVTQFKFGSSGFGEPFASWGNTSLQCVIRKFAPAHTTVLFSYS